ncbi:MAG: CopG family transcriptional regulator [Acidimicrobiales bacterium]
MVSTRTQIYLTRSQRAQLDELGHQRGVALAVLVREAIDRYLGSEPDADRARALADTFGSLVELEVPDRDEWDAEPAVHRA